MPKRWTRCVGRQRFLALDVGEGATVLPRLRLGQGWIVTGPVTMLPTACTGTVFPVMRSEPTTRLPLTSTPPVLAVTRTGPMIVLGSQAPPPMSTGPVVAVIVSGPVIVAPQMRIAAAPVAVS